MEDADGYWIIGANSSIYIIAELGGPDVPWGGDQATFFFGEANCPAWDQTQYTCDTGLHSWARTLDDEWKLYNLSIPAWCRSRFNSLSVQPVYIAQGVVNATPEVPERVYFNASGDIAILAWSLGNFTNLALQLDGMVLKRNDYADKMDYPCVLVADVVFQSEWLKFSARVPAGEHFLDIWGSENETIYYAICHGTADFDRDLLLDYEELMEGNAGLSPRWANPWGYRSFDEPYENIPLERVIEENEVQGYWVRESTYFYVPDAYDGIPQNLMILDVNGRYTNITIDSDSSKLRDKTLYAYHGEGDKIVELIPPSGMPEQYWADEVMAPDWAFVENVQSGWHGLSYLVYKSPLETPQLGLFLNDQQVAIIGAMTNYPSDRDGDSVPDASELSATASLTWRQDSLLQLTVPCDRTAAADVQIKFQVVRGENDPDPEKLLEWHAAEDAGRQVRLTQVLILYGPGSNAPARGQVDYWNNLDDLCHFLNATHPWPVDTYNLIGKDANGFANNSVLTGDCDPLPQDGTAAYDYQMILFPSLAERVAEYTLWYPSDHPAIQNDGTIVLRARFAIAAIDQSRVDPNDYSLLGLYDYPSNLTIAGAQVSFLSDVNGLLGEPRDSATHLACWFYNMNPAMAMDWDPEIERAIVADFTGAHFMTQYNYDPRDNTTLSAVERLNYARNQTPWDGRSAEVTYFTQTMRTLDLLSKINQSIQYDLITGEQYCRYPKMYDFASIAPGRYLNPGFPLIPGWTCTAGMGNAKVLRNVQTRAGVLELEPSTGGLTLHADRGVANTTGRVSLAVFLESATSNLEIRIGNGIAPDTIALLTEDGFLKYRDDSGTPQPIYELWPGEWFDLSIDFDNTHSSFDVSIDGAMIYSATNLSAWHPWQEIQTVDIIAKGGKSCLDGIGLYWSDLHPSWWEESKCFESVHYGDVAERSSFFMVSDVYNGSYAPGDPELAGDEIALFQTYYSGFVHSMERANILNWPTSFRLLRASDSSLDDFSIDNYLNVSFVQGTYIPAIWLPGQDDSPYSWARRDVPDGMIFRNLLLNEWADPNLNDFPATITLNIGDDARWEWDWRVGEIDPWAEFHARHTPAEGKAAVDHSLNNAMNLIDEAVAFADDIIVSIDKGEIPDFPPLITYYPVLGGHLLLDKPSLEQINVGGTGVIPSSNVTGEKLSWFKEVTTRDTLRASCEELKVQASNARSIIYCPKGEQRDLFRYVKIIPDKLKELCPELWDLYVSSGNKLPRDLIQSLPYDENDPSKSAIEVLGAGAKKEEQVGLRWQYVRWVRKTITPRDKLNTAIGIGAAIDSDRPRFIDLAAPNAKDTYNAMREKNLGLDLQKEKYGLGVPGEWITIEGSPVQLPYISKEEEKKPYVLKTLKTVRDPSGKPVEIKVIYFPKEPINRGQWDFARPFTHFDPQSLPNTIAFNSERQGSKLQHTFQDDIYKKIRAAADETKNPLLKEKLKEKYQNALKILQKMSHGPLKKNLNFKSGREAFFDPTPGGNVENNKYKDNIFSDIYQELKKNPYPLESGVPQVPPEKPIFLLEGDFREMNPAPWSRLEQRGMRTFEWEGRITFRVPGPETPLGGDWARLIEKIASPHNIPEATQNRMNEAAENSRQDWREIFARADHLIADFLRFLARIKADERMRQDPGIYLKVIAMAKNVINILKQIFPQNGKWDLAGEWLDSVWVKLFGVHGPRGLSFEKLIKGILADGLNIKPLDIDAALQIEGIRPTPLTQEEFLEFCQSGELTGTPIKADVAEKTGTLASNEATKPAETSPELNSKKSSPTTEARVSPSSRDLFDSYCDLLRSLQLKRPLTREELEELIEEERIEAIAHSTPVPGLLGPRGYVARVGAAITFDIFFLSTLPKLNQALAQPIFQVMAQSLSPLQLTSIANEMPLQWSVSSLGQGAPAGWFSNPAYEAFFDRLHDAYQAMQTPSVYPNSLAMGGNYFVPNGNAPLESGVVISNGGGNPVPFSPGMNDNLNSVFNEADDGMKDPSFKNIEDALLDPPSAPSQLWVRVAQVGVILSIITYGLSAINLIQDYERGAPAIQLALDWISLGLAAVQVGIAIEALALTTETFAIAAGTMAISDALLTAGTVAEFLSASAVTFVAVIIVMAISLLIYSVQERELRWAETLNTVNPSIETRINFPASTNASIVRNMCLHPNDTIGLQMTVGNQGYMTWDRYVNVYEHQPGVLYEAFETEPRTSTGAPFWFQSRVRVGSPGALGDNWTAWEGPSEGDPVDWDTWGSDAQSFNPGDLLYPEMLWRQQVPDVVAPWDVTTARSANVTYTHYATIPATTASLVVQLETRFDTTFEGRTNGTAIPSDVIIIGDANGDGHIDPLYGEDGLPVLEVTLNDFLAACQNVTPPAVTLDDIWSNFTTSALGYQWRDAENYLTQLLAQAGATTVIPESQFNATVTRLVELKGVFVNQTWRTFGASGFETDPVPTSVADNYYLFQTQNANEWMTLLGSERGVTLRDAGWRAARPLFSPADGILYSQDFSHAGNFPEDWERSCPGSTYVNWRNPDLKDQLVLCIEENYSVNSQRIYKDFGTPLLGGRLCVTLEYAALTKEIIFGWASSQSFFPDGYPTPVGMFRLKYDPVAGGARIYEYAGTNPLFNFLLPPYAAMTFIIDLDIMAGTVTLTCPVGSATCPVFMKIPATRFSVDIGTLLWPVDDNFKLFISYLSLSNRNDRDTQLNGYGLTSPAGQILVSKTWNVTTRQAFDVIKAYPLLRSLLPCKTNINATYSWGTDAPVLEAGGSFAGTIEFTYKGTDNPGVAYEFIAPDGWDITYDARQGPLKGFLQVPFVLEAPPGAPAGTYYVDFVERRADGSPLSGNVTFACRIPIHVRYNATWALEVAGLADILAPGSSSSWATLFNSGTSPQQVYITGDGVPLGWLVADGYAPMARWDFNGGTGGWVYSGTSGANFEADRLDITQMQSVNDLHPDAVAYSSDFRASRYYEVYLERWVHERTYFSVPAAAPTYVNPRSATLHEYIAGASASVPSPSLIISPASGPFTPGTLTWNSQPGFAPDQHAAARLASTIPATGWVTLPGLAFGATYAAWIEEFCTAQVYGYGTGGGLRAYVLHAYDKVTSDDSTLVLQSNANEVIAASKNISALVYPGDRVRITYENFGSAGATLGAWGSFALAGSGRQERVFVADGFYTLAYLTVSAAVGPGATFSVDSISLERALSRHAPLAEYAFAGETATPEMYGWSAVFGSGTATMQVPVPVTNAAYVDQGNPLSNYNNMELWVGSNPSLPYFYGAAFLEIPQPTGWYSSFGPANPPLLLTYQTDPSPVQAFPCGAFNETTLTWATRPAVESNMGVNGSIWASQPWEQLWAWDLSNFSSDHVCLNTSANGWWIFPSDEAPADIRPKVMYTISKWGVTGGALVIQSDKDEPFRVSRALADSGRNLTVRAGDKVWASFETTSAGGATLVLANADPLGANLTFPLATAIDKNHGTIYREFVIPAGGNYTALAIDGALGAGQNFSLAFAGVYRYQPYGTPLASASIGGYYNETISPSEFTQYAPLAGGCFTFDGTTGGFTGNGVSTANGNLVLAPSLTSVVTATCALAGLVIPADTRARARYNSTASVGSYIKFITSAGNLTWVLPIATGDSWQETTFELPQCNITAIIIRGTFTPSTNLSLDYLALETPAAASCVLPEVAGRRDVVALKNVAACGGAVNYTFPEPQSCGRLDFSIYAPGTNATLAITLEGTGGAGIPLAIADWQLWLGNLSGAFAAAGIYGGWHSLSIAWDCASHNYTVWYFNQTLVEANYSAGWGILNFAASAITGIRFGTADARSAYYLDGVYFDSEPAWPSNQSLVETFRPGAGTYVEMHPGDEWTLQLAAPPRSPLTAPGTYPVHLAIYDASTGQLIGLVHKDITIPAFYDIGLTCDAPVQIQQADSYTSMDGDFTFEGLLTNLANVEQTLTLSAPGLASRVAGTFYVDTGGAWEIGGSMVLAPGETKAWKLEILDAPAIACIFTIEARSSDNMTSIPVSFVYNAPPIIEGGQFQGPIFVEWQPAGKDLLFTAWDNTTQDAWFEAWWNNIYLGQGTWASGQAINVSLDPLFAAGASILGVEQDVAVLLRDGYTISQVYTNVVQFTIVIDDILPATITPPDVVTTWESTFESLTWALVDNGAWDPATSWQDDFGDGTLGPQWLPANVTEVNGTLRLPPPAQDWMGTQLLAPAPAGEDFAVVTRLAYVPTSGTGAGIVIPTDDDGNFIKWEADSRNGAHTSWNLREWRFGIGATTYGPVTGVLTNLAVVVHGAGPAATYDLWYCLEDTTWTRVVAGHTAFSEGAPARRAFGLCAGVDTLDAEFDWVRCQTLRPAPGATYTVYKNGTPVASGGWAGFGTVALSLDDLRPLGPALVGSNNFTLVLADPVGGRASSTAWVNITQVAPVLSQPPDYSCVEGDTPTITWDVFDNYAVTPTYTIYLGLLGAAGTPLVTGTWISGRTISRTLDALTPGTYACRLIAMNDLGGVTEDRVILTVVQTALVPASAVTSTELPAGENQPMMWAAPSLSLEVTLTTTADVTLVAGAWDGNPVVGVPPELAAEGAYFSLAASDETAIQFPLTLTVTFPYNPAYGWSEADLARWVGAYVYDEGTGAWELADCTVLGVRRYGTLEGSFVDVTLSVQHLSLFAIGLLNLPPALSAPADIAYMGGSTGHTITWQVTDDTALDPTYTITRDGFGIGSGAWSTDNIIMLNVDGLVPGAHNFTLVVDDGRYGAASDSVMVVVDNFAPAVAAPPDITCAWGTSGNAITWHLADDTIQNPTYAVTRDGTLVGSGSWPLSNLITLNVDGLAVGTYWYRLTVLNTLPLLSAPLDASFEYGSAVPTIAWTVVDGTVLAGTYTITLGGFPVAEGAWSSGDTIAWAPAGSLPGSWAATLTVSDGYDGITSDSVAITVTNAPPAITGPHSAVFEAGNASAGAWATVTDLSTASDAAYSIYRNGTRVASGRWASGGNIFVDLRFTPPGRHDFEVIAWDGLGGVATHAILATTTNMLPVVTAPAPITFEAGTAAPVLNWTITDESAENATYALYVNGGAITNSTWASGDIISFPVGTFLPGSYTVTLAAADGWGAVVENGTWVTVTNAAPVVLAPLPIAYEAGDPRPVATFVVTDASTLAPIYAAYLDGSPWSTGTWVSGLPITIPASGATPGVHVITLVAQDGFGAENLGEVSITVWPDDDATCDLANLTCSATSFNVTFTCDLVDPSGYASLDWVRLNGTNIPLANLSLVLNGTRATALFNYTFATSGTYVLQLQLTDGDHDWPGDGTAGVFTCVFEVTLADPVETLLEAAIAQLGTFIATARGIDEWVWRALIVACGTRARSAAVTALDCYQAGQVTNAEVRAKVAQALVCVADVLVQVGSKVTGGSDPVWGELHAQAGAIKANLASVIQLLEAL